MEKDFEVMENNTYKEGMLILEQMLGEGKKEYIEKLNSIYDGLGDTIVEQVFGKLYTRNALDLKTRELTTVALLLSNGDKEQLLFHTQCALNLGITKEQIIEVILHSITIIGMPRALAALKAVKELLDAK